ncbi:hypothetical protein ACQPX6_16295 [Actinomycetospora sp. CA-101289]|uniref:hypothetical protein n=1 Tax=Actinomycetospora sp. CA-101289 TaxID=3239893 RepID=UPI003D96C7F2
MTTKKSTAGTSVPGAGWVRPWMQLVELSWSVPVVIGYRTARIVAGGWPPSARDRRELTRMVQEKVETLGKVAVAAVTTPPKDTARAVGNVVAPVHRTVVANRRRLLR